MATAAARTGIGSSVGNAAPRTTSVLTAEPTVPRDLAGFAGASTEAQNADVGQSESVPAGVVPPAA
ncbi:MAG TPA: hypothetical protein VMJ65_13335 [Solirubrobacteraceae bacterium]|nr:hypothetical protein [Solirubrobacteraceae bacterium]